MNGFKLAQKPFRDPPESWLFHENLLHVKNHFEEKEEEEAGPTEP